MLPIEGSGRKAEGLARLPRQWVPEYFVVTRDLISGWPAPAEGLRDWLSDGPGAFKLLQVPNESQEGLIVRSSGVAETLRDRGLYQSHRCDFSPDGIVDAATKIWNDAREIVGTPPTDLPLIVQRYVPPVVAGHLSNERRVHWRSRDWMCEISWPSRTKRPRFRLRVTHDDPFPTHLSLVQPKTIWRVAFGPSPPR